MGARTKEIALVLCLLVLAGGMAIASEPLVPPVFGVRVEQVVTTGVGTGPGSGFNAMPGTLVVVVTSSYAFNNLYTARTVNATVSVVPTGISPLYPVTYRTNSSGGLVLTLKPTNYSVSIFDLPMNISVPVKVLPGATTDLHLTVTGNVYQGALLEVPANGSDVVPAWAHGTIELTSYVALLGSDAAFLDLSYSAGSSLHQTGEQGLLTPLLVTGSQLRSAGNTSVQWITFQPETPVVLSGLASVQLAVYGDYATVTTYGGSAPGN